jgi:hypothetical protein
MEACSMIYLKQSLSVAAYEGARTAIIGGATAAETSSRAQKVLSERRVNGGSVTISPADPSTVDVGQYVTVTVSAPGDSNAVIRGWFFNSSTIEGQVTMMKEF